MLDCRTLSIAEFGWDLHVDRNDQVTALFGGVDALAFHAMAGPRLRSHFHAQGHRRTTECRYLNIGAERCVSKGDGNCNGEVHAAATEHIVRHDLELDEQVTVRAVVPTRAATPLQANGLAIFHTGRQPSLNLAWPFLDTTTAAGTARLVNQTAGTRTQMARRRKGEHALVVVCDTAALTVPARPRGSARLRARPMAG